MSFSNKASLEPLSSFSCFRTNSIDKWNEYIKQNIPHLKCTIGKSVNFNSYFNFAELKGINLYGVGNNTNFFAKNTHDCTNYRIGQLTSGRHNIHYNGSFKFNSEQPISLFQPDKCETQITANHANSIVIEFSKQILYSTITSTHTELLPKIKFYNFEKLSRPLEYFTAYILNLTKLINDDTTIVSHDLIATQHSTALLLTILATFPNNICELINTDHTNPHKIVKTAEEFIEANSDKPIKIADIVKITGTSLRTLQNAFKKHRDYTPSKFLQICRLNRAYKMLQGAERHTTILSVALECGFQCQSRFSQYFYKKFGKKPSEILLK